MNYFSALTYGIVQRLLPWNLLRVGFRPKVAIDVYGPLPNANYCFHNDVDAKHEYRNKEGLAEPVF